MDANKMYWQDYAHENAKTKNEHDKGGCRGISFINIGCKQSGCPLCGGELSYVCAVSDNALYKCERCGLAVFR